MSDIKVNCPHCKQRLEVPEEMLGTVAECPSCKGQIQLPSRQSKMSTNAPQPQTRGTQLKQRVVQTPLQEAPIKPPLVPSSQQRKPAKTMLIVVSALVFVVFCLVVAVVVLLNRQIPSQNENVVKSVALQASSLQSNVEQAAQSKHASLVANHLNSRKTETRQADATRLMKMHYEAKEYAKAIEASKKADLEDASVQFILGRLHETGLGITKNGVEAVKWYKKSADQGLAKAQNNLGNCYLNGIGVEKNETAAVNWFRKAADQGLAFAQYNLGFSYAEGAGVTKDELESARWFQKAAEQGNSDAQFSLGVCYVCGKGVSKDMSLAVNWLRKAAEQKNVSAQYNLGYLFQLGDGVSKDMTEAVKWYRQAANNGQADAQFCLGVLYLTGDGVSKDRIESVKWLIKASNQGHAKAKELIAGVPQDIKDTALSHIDDETFVTNEPKADKMDNTMPTGRRQGSLKISDDTAKSKRTGKLTVNVTFEYNKYVGHKPDVGAIVLLIPKEYKTKIELKVGLSTIAVDVKHDEKLASAGLKIEKVNGFGKAIFNRIPVGEYTCIIQSNKNNNYGMDKLAQLTANMLGEYFTGDLQRVAEYRQYDIEQVTIEPNEETEISYDFGITGVSLN